MRLLLPFLALAMVVFGFIQVDASDPAGASLEETCVASAQTPETLDSGPEQGLQCGDMYPRPVDAMLVVRMGLTGEDASRASFAPSTFTPVEARLDERQRQVDADASEGFPGVLVVVSLPEGGSATYLMKARGLVALPSANGLVAGLEMIAPHDHLMLRFTTPACPVRPEGEDAAREPPITTGVFAQGRATFLLGEGPEACPDVGVLLENLGYWTIV